MSTLHLLDPELRTPQTEQGFGMSSATLPAMRKTIVEMFRSSAPTPEPKQFLVPGPEGAPDVPLRLYSPSAVNGLRPAIYYIHGGGYVVGTAAMMDSFNWQRALEHNAVVVAVDYRLAPETPFPGPIDDCYAGLRWLFANVSTLGIDPTRIIIMGESAGGGLAAALALVARDRAEVQPAGQCLIYPMLDDRTGTHLDPHPNATTGEFGWTRESNSFGWLSYRGGYPCDDARVGHFSPARAIDLQGLPRTFIGVGALDLLMEEDVEYARRLSRAGVPVELHVYPGAVHGFDFFAEAQVARQFEHDKRMGLSRML